jgi:hypothetical protein
MKEETKCYCGHTTYCDCGPEESKQETLEEPCVQCCGTGEIQKSTNRKQSNFECDICNGRGYWDKVIEPKQETLEEAAERYASHSLKEERQKDLKMGFIEGAKWQQENSNINALDFEIDALKREIKVLKHQQERSYSEEEVIAFGEFIFKHSLLTHTRGVKSLFEQFKKK